MSESALMMPGGDRAVAGDLSPEGMGSEPLAMAALPLENKALPVFLNLPLKRPFFFFSPAGSPSDEPPPPLPPCAASALDMRDFPVFLDCL
jgi:hypothetical protein